MKRRNATKARTAKNAKRDPDEARRNRADELRRIREAEEEEAAERWRGRFLVATRPWSTGDAPPWLPFARSAVRALGVDVREADHFERTGRFDPASANLPLLYDSTRWLWERAPRPAEACRVAVDALARLGGRARGLRAVAPAPRPGAWDALLLPRVGLYAVPTPEPGTEYARRLDARQREEGELLRVFREAEAKAKAATVRVEAPPSIRDHASPATKDEGSRGKRGKAIPEVAKRLVLNWRDEHDDCSLRDAFDAFKESSHYKGAIPIYIPNLKTFKRVLEAARKERERLAAAQRRATQK